MCLSHVFLSENAPVPVMVNELLFFLTHRRELIIGNVAPYFNIKFSKSGGILNVLNISYIVEVCFIPCMSGCWSKSRLAITNAFHFAMSSENIIFYNMDSFMKHTENSIRGDTVDKELLEISETAGIGVEPDFEFLME